MLDHIDSVPSDEAGKVAGRRELMLDGELWAVYVRPAGENDRDQEASLVFESRSAIRRVRHYPADWYSMTDAALRTLSWTR